MVRTSACDSIKKSLDLRTQCFFSIPGNEHCCNDALFKPALPRRSLDPNFKQQTLVYFGGDIQNFTYLMDDNDPNILNEQWCLETTATMLSAKFPQHHIVVIKPSRIEFEHISCFDNFVRGNFVGVPDHMYHYDGVPHLEMLLKQISRKIRRMPAEDLLKMMLKTQDEDDFFDTDTTEIVWQYEMMSTEKKRFISRWQKHLRLDQYPLTLVGFSKGCVVLNQFLYEFHYAKRLDPDKQKSSFIDRIEAMYWLDGGHPGKKNVYLTSRGLLKTLVDLGIEVHSHVSQYQIDDFTRPWIRQQWQGFVSTLKDLNAKLIVHRHLRNSTDLHSHFQVLLTFKEVEISSESVVPTPALPASRVRTVIPSELPSTYENITINRSEMDQELLGVALVSPNSDPYLALQLILRQPSRALTDEYGSVSNVPLEMPSASSQKPSTSAAGNRTAPITPQYYEAGAKPYIPTGRNLFRIPPTITDLKVFFSNPTVNFDDDPGAREEFSAANYYKLEAPLIATPVEMNVPKVIVYTPFDDIHTPLVLKSDRVSVAGSLDSAAATPHSWGAAREMSRPSEAAAINFTPPAPNIAASRAFQSTCWSSQAIRPTQTRLSHQCTLKTVLLDNPFKPPSRAGRSTQNSHTSRAIPSTDASPVTPGAVLSTINNSQASPGAVDISTQVTPRSVQTSTSEDVQTSRPSQAVQSTTRQNPRRNLRPRVHSDGTPYSGYGRTAKNRHNLRSVQ